jgi:hypothetical protein
LSRIGNPPEPFEIVERPLLGSENVGDDGPQIDENPAAVGVAFRARDRKTGGAGFCHDRVRDRTRLNLRAAGGDDERVGDDRASVERKREDVLALEVERGVPDQVDQFRQKALSFSNRS